MLPITTAFLTFPIWPPFIKSKRFITFFWPLGIGAILFFAGTLLVIMSHYHHMQVMIMMINILVAVLLLQWPLVLFLGLTGAYAAIWCFKQYTGAALLLSTFGAMQMVYLIILFTCLLIVLKSRQAYRGLATAHAQMKTENNFTSQMWLATLRGWAKLHHDATSYSPKVLQQTRQLEEQLHPYNNRDPTKAQLIADNATLHQYTYQLDIINKHLNQVLHQAQQPMTLNVKQISLTEIQEDALSTLYQHQQATNVITQHRTVCQTLGADPQKIQRLLTSGLAYTMAHQQDQQPILVGFADTHLTYPVSSIPGYIKHVQALCITMTTTKARPSIHRHYLGCIDHEATQWPQDIAALPLSYNQQIVEAHYGFADMIHQLAGLTLVYVIPWDVREVRPPIMDHWQEEGTASRIAPSEDHPSENSFIQAAQTQTSINHQLLQQAIRFIKYYHGRATQHHTGELYYLHSLAVASIVLDYTQDVNTLLAALMHEVIDQTHCSLHQIALQFNPAVQRIVEGVTCVDSRLKSCKKLQLAQDENIRKLIEIKDERVLYVRLADRMHNMRTIQAKQYENQRRTAEETLLFFVPLAEQLGFVGAAEELKERCFAVLNGKLEV